MKKIVLLILSVLLLGSCSKEEVGANALKMELVIYVGFCGQEAVSITENQIVRDKTKFGCNEKGKISKYGTDEQKFKQLLQYIEELDLFSLEQEDCQRCLDGTDYAFKLTEGNRQNSFVIGRRYGDGLSDGQQRQQELLDFLDGF